MNRRILLIASAVASTTALLLMLFHSRTSVPEQFPLKRANKPPVVQTPQKPKSPSSALPQASAPRGLAVRNPGVLAEIAALGPAPSPGQKLALVEKLAALGPGSEAVLATALRSARTGSERGILADALVRMGTSEAVDALFGIIHSTNDSDERAELLHALDALPPGQPLETLASSLALPLDPQVRDAVIATIARAADSGTVQFLYEMYTEPETHRDQTGAVLAALGSIHNPGAAHSIAELLRTSGDVAILQASATALGKIGTAESLQAIASSLSFLENTNPDLRQFLLHVIESVNNPSAREWLQNTAVGLGTGDPSLAKAASTALKAVEAASQ